MSRLGATTDIVTGPKRGNRGGGFRHQGRRDGRVESMCWCDTRIVLVTEQEVWDGVTRSCRRPGCDPTSVAARRTT